MKRSLSGMKRQQETQAKQGAADQQTIRETVEHYGRKNKDELFDELKRVTGETEMDAERMDALARQIAPMLSEEQRQRMREVLEKLKQ